jgi:[ribosomal protein S5]-alanine N-acetyltransferase
MMVRGERCLLRPWRVRDAPSVVRYANNANVSRYLRDRFPYPYTMAHARGFLAGAVGEEGEPTKFAIAVDDEAVGGIGLIPGADIEQFSAEIGYWLGEPFWGRGIVSEALVMVTEHAFQRLNLLRLFAFAFTVNVGSVRVLEKAGYEREGCLKSGAVKHGQVYDQLLYARVNPSWRGAG